MAGKQTWIAVKGRGIDEFIERFETCDEAIDCIVDDWDHLTPRERRDAHDYAGLAAEDYDETGDVAEIVLDFSVTMEVYFGHGDNVYYVEVPEMEDVWKAIEIYDRINGTDLWEHLGVGNVMGVNSTEYPRAEQIESWDDVEEDEDDRIQEVSADIKVGTSGHSLILTITDQARMLGVDRGDIVEVTIRRK